MKTVLVHCWWGGRPVMNLGEWFCELILAKLGYGIRYWPQDCIEPDEPPLMLLGSGFNKKTVDMLLEQAREVYVWGSGNGEPAHGAVNLKDYGWRVHICALRGPVTAKECGAPDVPLCDPGWLLPWALPLERKPSGEMLDVPHILQRPGRDPWLDVLMTRDCLVPAIQRIANAEFVSTSTLHTLIAAMAYGVPCCLRSTGDLNMPQKWRDVFGVVPENFSPPFDDRTWWREVGSHYRDKQDTQALIASFPHYLAREA